MAEIAGTDIAERIEWIESDLATWTAEPGHYDLVVCLYVHVAGSVEDMVGRMANGVAPGGPDLSHRADAESVSLNLKR